MCAQPVLIPLCRKGDRAGIERLLQGGASLDEVDVEGNSPLHVAVEAPRNEVATVQCLLAAGSDPNARNYIAATPLHYVCLRKSNHRSIANILLEGGAEVDAPTLAGKSPLHFACENQLAELVESLCLFGADVNLQDADNSTPMHLALAKEGGRDTVRVQILEQLLRYGAQAHLPNSSGVLPVHLACRAGAIRCMQMLYEQVGPEGLPPTGGGSSCLHLACLGGFPDATQWLVQVSPGSINMADAQGNTPLHCCAMTGGYDCAALLLRAGADAVARNCERKTALDIAKTKGTDLSSTHSPELAQMLRDASGSGSCHQS